MKQTQPQYNCTQQELYAGSRTALTHCFENLAELATGNKWFTSLRLNELSESIDSAEAISAEAFDTEHSLLRTLYVGVTANNLINWQILKTYIVDAYPGEILLKKLHEAGSSYYGKALNGNWNDVLNLMNAGSFFLTENIEALTADDNMPADFQHEYNDSLTEWSGLSLQYIESSDAKALAVEEKIAANNSLYLHIAALCEDAQQVFVANDKLKSAFSLEALFVSEIDKAFAPMQRFTKAA